MAIEKNNFKVSRLDSEVSPQSRETMSSDEDELQGNPALESDDDDEFDDADSGAGSDDFDLLELGETGTEFCQIGNQTCSVPLELYDLPGLEHILSVEVWNECLSEGERFELAMYLPDMEQVNSATTLKELFTGCNFHFGSPIKKLFDMLKGGLCDPRVALYKEGLNFLQKRQHYHLLRKRQNIMVMNLCQIRDAWINCWGYSIEERLRVLNIMRSQKSLMYEKMEDLEVDSSDEVSGEGIWSRKIKDRKILQKKCRYASHGASSGLEFHSGGQLMIMEPEKYGKLNPKGTLKLAGLKKPLANDLSEPFPIIYHALEMNAVLNSSETTLPGRNKSVGYNSGSMLGMRDQLRKSGSAEEITYELGQRDCVSFNNLMDKSGVLSVGRRREFLRGSKIDTDSLMDLSLSSKANLHAYSRHAKQSSDMKMFTAKPSSTRGSNDIPRKPKCPRNAQQFVVGDQRKFKLGVSLSPLKGNQMDLSDHNELFYNDKTAEEEFTMDSSFKYADWKLRSKKWKTGRDSPDLNYNAYRSPSLQVSDRCLPSPLRTKLLQENIRETFIQNGGQDTVALRGNRILLRSEETESDSSEQLNDDEDINPLLQCKFSYSMGTTDDSCMSTLKSYRDLEKANFVRKDLKEHGIQIKRRGGFGVQGHKPGVENHLSKGKQKGKIRSGGCMLNSNGKILEESFPSGSNKLNDGDDDWREVYKLGKNGRIQGKSVERFDLPSVNAYNAEPKKKGRTGLDYSILRSKYLHDHIGDEEDDSLETRLLGDDNGTGQNRYGRKGQKYDANKSDQHERSKAPLLGCNSATKKRKVKVDVDDWEGRDEDANLLRNILPQIDDLSSLKRKLKKKETETVRSDMENSELPVTDMETDMELETKPQKKPFTLITPTVHTGFSFSIIHLLSAVRVAMISPLAGDSLEVGKPREEQNKALEGSVNGALFNKKVTANCEHANELNMPSLTVQEIVNYVSSNPGDPCILETQEPLQDLVRGVLKIFSSKTAPLGAKGWKVLVVYEKSRRSWSWAGPISHNSSNHDAIEEVTSPETWGLPCKTLVKLVDSFANWLKCGQETLQQIGRLPSPPLALMQISFDEKERFRDLRAQKSLNTISPSSEEVRTYFRKEEVLRYSIPDRAFSYTAADGKKSIVAPLRRCGGKPTSKARDHFMLKRDRPPHVTILCLVRDAAARLPGSIGTRADVCTLIRDSQYIVEDVSDAQINQVVSGALDRLHYERDPCVQFDGERKLWVYLHREREEEDFEDDGTSSTKKWKRQRKDATDPSDQGTVTVAYNGSREQSGYDLCSDLNVEPSCIDDEKGMEPVSNDLRLNVDDKVDVNNASQQGNVCRSNSLAWEEALGLNPTQENKLQC